MANNNEQPAPTTLTSDASEPRNVRGFTRGLGVDDLIKASNGAKLPVVFCESKREPVCVNGPKLASECGIIVRSLAPLRYKSWTKIPRCERIALIERVKNKFLVDTSLPMVREFLLNSMATKYSSRRNKMVNLFVKSSTVEDAKKKPYKDVSQEDWDWLCDHLFSTDAFKKRSAAGVKARQAVPYSHRGGSRSHAVHIEAKRKKGVVQPEIQTFYDTHTYIPEGQTEAVWVSDEARIRWDKINELLQQGIEEGATPPTEAEVCAQALKKKRRRQCTSTVDSNGESLHEMIQQQADRIQAQETQICAQNDIIKELKEDNEKFRQTMIREQQDYFRRLFSTNINNSGETANNNSGETTNNINSGETVNNINPETVFGI